MDHDKLYRNIEFLKREFPYKKNEYARKNWGHPLHSLCSYQGKLKPAVAHWLVRLFSEEGEKVFDPLGGVGTIGLEASLQGRHGFTNDISLFAAVVAKAKVSFPNKDLVWNEYNSIISQIKDTTLTDEDYAASEFGLNAKVKDYFHKDTLDGILKIRQFLLQDCNISKERAFVASNMLHILHGNRPYALSRTSHSLTPFNPKGDYVYKDVGEKLKERLSKTLEYSYPENCTIGKSFYGDYKLVDIDQINCIITSPPFVGMRFDRPNWMRLWMCGWGAQDFLERSLNSLDRQQTKNWDVYHDFFEKCNKWLTEDGVIVLHLGGSSKYDMVDKLIRRSQRYFKVMDIVSEDVSTLEKHGVKDKGTTNQHVFLFLNRN